MQTAHRVPRTLLSPTPDLLTDLRARAAYSEGAGIHRIVPTAVAVPRGVEELQRLVRWAADSGRPPVARGGGGGQARGGGGPGGGGGPESGIPLERTRLVTQHGPGAPLVHLGGAEARGT